AFQRAEGCLGLGQLHVARPEFLGAAGLQIGAQQVGAFPEFAPYFTIFLDRPAETNALGRVAHRDLVEIVYLGMAGLNASQPPLHFVAVFQPAGLDGYRLTLHNVFHASRNAVPAALTFSRAAAAAAQ